MKVPTVMKGAVMLAVAALAFAACGGGGGDGGGVQTGAATVSKGAITGFGSVYVNGVKFATSASTGVIIDDASVSVDTLHVGMIVKVNGRVNDDGATGSADSIEYEDNLKGPVANKTATGFSVLGQSVIVTATTVFQGAANLAALANGQVVEVSGFLNADGSITATLVEVKATPGFKIRGTVANLGATTFTLTVSPTLSYTVDFSAATKVPVTAALKNGDYVKVTAAVAPNGSTIVATKISIRRAGMEDATRAEVEGIVSNYNAAAKTFTVNGVNVNASALTLPAGFGNGMKVEAKGPIINGILIASAIEVEQENQQELRELKGTVTAKSAATLTVGTTQFLVTGRTIFHDASDRDNRLMSLADIAVGDLVEVKYHLDSAGMFVADKIEREQAASTTTPTTAPTTVSTTVATTVPGTTTTVVPTTVPATTTIAPTTIATTIATTTTVAPACGSCHAIPPANGDHLFHVSTLGFSCSICHGAGYSSTAVNAATHINGVIELVATVGWNAAARTCTNSCHGTRTW